MLDPAFFINKALSKLINLRGARTKYSDCIILLFTEMWSKYNT